jgi:hypothetical protein
MSPRVGAAALAALVFAGGLGPARAAVDLNGPFLVYSEIQGSPTGECIMTFTQTGTALSVTGCKANASGTIDPETGAFTVSGTCPLGALTITATAAQDSYTWAGQGPCGDLMFDFFGTRCGNDVLDPGEECDRNPGDLC